MAKERVKKKLAINPEEAEMVRLIYDWYLSDMGAKAIAERLNSEGYTYRGKPWSKNRILDIVGDEAYLGRYYFNKRDGKTNQLKPREEWILIPVEPIVYRSIWEKAKALKEERTPQARSDRNPAVIGSKTLLTGLALCGPCGARMGLETAKGGKYTYYNCSNYLRRGKSSCPGQRIPAHSLEKAVLDHMANRLFTKKRVKEILKGIYREIKEADRRKEGQRKRLIRQLEVIETKLTRQYEAIESGVVNLQDVGERIRALKVERTKIEENLMEIKTHPAIPLHCFKDESIEEFQKTVRELFLGGDRRVTKRYLKLFIEKIVINLPKVEIVGKPEVVLAVLTNKKAARTDGVLTALGSWLPGTDSNRRLSG